MKRDKILLLTGSLGDGHIQAAKAIMEAAKLHHPEAEIVAVDFMEWTHPYLHSVGQFCYLQWVKNLPSVYGYLYRKTRSDNKWSALFKRIRSFRTYRMLELLQSIQPTKVVSTFPGAAAAMSFLRSAGFTEVATATVITDYTDHSYWIHPFTDCYLVGAEHVKEALLQYGVRDTQIKLTGIPIREPFSKEYDRDQLRVKYGLSPNQPVVLIMGGGFGLIGKDLLNKLISGGLPRNTQFVIVCGRNKKLQMLMEEEVLYLGETIGALHNFRIMGYINEIHELMALSDLIVTKPGGLTVTEALSLELPMLLFKPLPGQEQANAAYLVGAGAALEASDERELTDFLLNVLSNDSLLNGMRMAAQRISRKHGAATALDAIMTMDNRYVSSRNGENSFIIAAKA
ncbi:MGDG synthase family glycosyltransferase [Paenibacillus cremeus]|uniref:Glycosyltransferase n=1 Tax=Paenibacillus cremeus TaxID=2163881 RepID=A0A559K4E3_9BACL|nr:glycosyltransferase [Paenibacillus cremeus]TVY07015.1 glycosyltransferase [Paenibacillus cremeus]